MVRNLLWFRNDLRLHDQPALLASIEQAAVWLPVYIFDIRLFHKTLYGWPRTGPFRGQFLLQSVADLRGQLRERGRDLLIRVGIPEEIIPELCRQSGITDLYFGKEYAPYEEAQEMILAHALRDSGTRLHSRETASLCSLEALPFTRNTIPDVFTAFRHKVEASGTYPAPLPVPESLPPLPDVDCGVMPLPEMLGFTEILPDKRAAVFFEGGETAALARLKAFVWDSAAVKSYFETRNEMLGLNNSSKFSAWLSTGSLSARQVMQEIRAFEKEQGANKSTYWIGFELLWRDFFRFSMARHGARYFRAGGLYNKPQPERQTTAEALNRWIYGETGDALVDANMNELRLTGFMSNRGRQNVASYLVHDLQMDWRAGASWFESQLTDYDVYSNYGNWAYIAGVGCDPRKDRYFNTERQASMYDPQGVYRKRWLE